MSGCGGGAKPLGLDLPKPSGSMRLTVAPSGQLPEAFTCDGKGTMPVLRWSAPPAGTRALAVLVIDLDGPDGPLMHYAATDLAPNARSVAGGVVSENSFGHKRYDPPCPPEGDEPHRYRFSVLALRKQLGLARGAQPADVVKAIREAAIARGDTTVTAQRG